MVSTTRLLLACAGLLVVWLDPAEPDRHTRATYLSLIAYVLYSGVLWLSSRQQQLRRKGPSYWIDIAWSTWLIALSSGTQSLFFFGFFFAILVASFGSGLQAGMLATIASVVLFGTVGYWTTPADRFELNRFILRPVYLLILGYMVAHWGEFELALGRRLRFLRQVSAIANPRFGIDRTIGDAMQRIRTFFGAEICVLVTCTEGTGEGIVRRCSRASPEAAYRPERLRAQAIRPLCMVPEAISAALHPCKKTFRPIRETRQGGGPAADPAGDLDGAAEFLGVKSLMTVTWPDRSTVATRLYVGSAAAAGFDTADLEFLTHVVDQLAPVLENIRLVDRLASDAAEIERHRIARDLHDSIVQPYIGIQLGLTAIDQKLRAGMDVSADVAHLAAVVAQETQEVRRYLSSLATAAAPGLLLRDALQRFTERFTAATGLAVAIVAAADLQVNDRLAAEVFQIVAEGVSNARRHTASNEVIVRLWTRDADLIVEIADSAAASAAPFTPRSIAERAAALGGRVTVDPHGTGHLVRVEIPL
jgi:signal transduction histidine kinase